MLRPQHLRRLLGLPATDRDVRTFTRWPVTVAAATIALAGCGTHAPPDHLGSATLSWQSPSENIDGSPVSDLKGYYIFYGTEPDSMTHQIRTSDAAVTTYVVEDLAPGTYYFTVAGYTASGAMGPRSMPVSKTIP